MELSKIKGAGDVAIGKLKELNIHSVEDMVEYLPISYCDYSLCGDLESSVVGDYVVVRGEITNIKPIHKGTMSYVKAVANAGSPVELIWFNQPYMARAIRSGEYKIYGKLAYYKQKYSITNPIIEHVDKLANLIGIQPIYKLKDKFTQSGFRKLMTSALSLVSMVSIVDIDINAAYHNVHFPTSVDTLKNGQRVLALDRLSNEFIAYKSDVDITNSYVKVRKHADISHDFTLLPYELTPSQATAIDNIISDMSSDKLMNRLVLGDVGSGKSIVAMLSMIYTMRAGYQSVMVAPSEILSKQHYNTFCRIFPNYEPMATYLSSKMPAKDKRIAIDMIENGSVSIIFATHSAMSQSLSYSNLGLVIYDEVHKFGVKQKGSLSLKYNDIDTLIMSATPQPRTLSMELFGDLKISRIYKRESQLDVKTYTMNMDKVDGLYRYIKEKVAVGDQAFIVCPRLESNDGISYLSANNLYEALASNQLKDCRLALIYGAMSEPQKANIMDKFSSGEIDVLIATSVVEVGIDQPNATVMAVFGANYFGLATLHQLRGRVGRGTKSGEVFYITDTIAENPRIEMLKSTHNGEELAMFDKQHRGFGELFGAAQSGNSGYEKYRIILTLDIALEAKALADKAIKQGIKMNYEQDYYINKLKDIVLN